ncbi:MAG TPA: 16S rRNA (cytidine(1402)-2'-O)-methyltransferase [Bacillota bacterium]|nr:16S rRNA (cytidine(1402)-2'-O)-methyltransferase [Bacillota bacterium]
MSNNLEQRTAGPGELYLVATPIGNLEDMTARAIHVLSQADLVAAEDTRRTRQLLNHFGISKPLVSYFQHNQLQREELLLGALLEGKKIALVSDAGMPGISDPGTPLVQAAVAKGIRVLPIPGASASISALAASGLPTDRFVFEGFLPRAGKERKGRLQVLAAEERTVILYEAPHRLRETLKDLQMTLGNDRRIAVARELTKVYEEFWRGNLEEAVAEFDRREPRGEFSLVIEGRQPEKLAQIDWPELLSEVEASVSGGDSPSDAIRNVAKRYDISRRQLYEAYQEKRRP